MLVRKLEVNEDPNVVRFETVPIWLQFKNIPACLLSKELARKLGRKIGHFIAIDNWARGDILDKILRARVHLPVARPLQCCVTLEDERNGEEVVVDVFYERLPSFCLCCGVIGHQEAACELPSAVRRRRYRTSLGVLPIHPDDRRQWYLPETAATNGRSLQGSSPWRRADATGAGRTQEPKMQLALLATVSDGVHRLSVKDGVGGSCGNVNAIINDTNKTTQTTATPNNNGKNNQATSTPNISDTSKIAIDTDKKTLNNVSTDTDAAAKKMWKRIARKEDEHRSTMNPVLAPKEGGQIWASGRIPLSWRTIKTRR